MRHRHRQSAEAPPPPPPPPPPPRCPVREGRVAAGHAAIRRALRGRPPAARHPQPPQAWPPAAPSSAVWPSCSRHARRPAAPPTAARPLAQSRRCHWLAVVATKRRASRCPGSRLCVRVSGLGLGYVRASACSDRQRRSRRSRPRIGALRSVRPIQTHGRTRPPHAVGGWVARTRARAAPTATFSSARRYRARGRKHNSAI